MTELPKNVIAMPRKDTRVVYGARCTWWDSISESRPIPGSTIPGCPHCHSPLFEVDSEGKWFQGVDAHEARGNTGYRATIEWARGKCFANMPAMAKAYAEREQ